MKPELIPEGATRMISRYLRAKGISTGTLRMEPDRPLLRMWESETAAIELLELEERNPWFGAAASSLISRDMVEVWTTLARTREARRGFLASYVGRVVSGQTLPALPPRRPFASLEETIGSQVVKISVAGALEKCRNEKFDSVVRSKADRGRWLATTPTSIVDVRRSESVETLQSFRLHRFTRRAVLHELEALLATVSQQRKHLAVVRLRRWMRPEDVTSWFKAATADGSPLPWLIRALVYSQCSEMLTLSGLREAAEGSGAIVFSQTLRVRNSLGTEEALAATLCCAPSGAICVAALPLHSGVSVYRVEHPFDGWVLGRGCIAEVCAFQDAI